jgi:ABC-type lipoprotein export system ATPase subunit
MAQKTNRPIISVEGLSKTFLAGESQVEALKDVNFQIKAGEYVAISGPSGSGKTTLMQILGLLDANFLGQVTFQQKSILSISNNTRAKLRLTTIGFVFQDNYLLPELSARDNVALPHWQMTRRPKQAQQKASGLLDSLGLLNRQDHKPGSLSGGEQQRVALARALVNDPQLVLADEPTAHLDQESQICVLNWLDLVHRRGTTVIVSSHNPIVCQRAQRCIRFDFGKIKNQMIQNRSQHERELR